MRFHVVKRDHCPLWKKLALYVLAVAAALLLGSLFSYYCMFAAVAVEFIAAVYYTFQLN